MRSAQPSPLCSRATARFLFRRAPFTRNVSRPNRPPFIVQSNEKHAAQSSQEVTTGPTSFYYHRKMETAQLIALVNKPPAGISVIVGPRNTGKTRLVVNLMGTPEFRNTNCYLDCRSATMATPQDLANALRDVALPTILQQQLPTVALRETFMIALRASFPLLSIKTTIWDGPDLSKIIAQLADATTQPSRDAEDSLRPALGVFDAVLDALAAVQKQRGVSPQIVIVVDEANALLEWRETHPAALRRLLKFFVKITKQTRRAHVLLLTSNWGFMNWLRAEIGADFFKTYVIGDVLEADAKAFLTGTVQELGSRTISDEEWPLVYQVCGGNLGTLRSFAVSWYLSTGDVAEALRDAMATSWTDIQRKGSPHVGGLHNAGYTAAQYFTAVAAILDSPFNAVDQDVLEARLGRDGPRVLEAMVKANLLAPRPYSPWAVDMNPDAFGPGRDEDVVTAPSALQLHLMRKYRSKWSSRFE